MTRKRNGVCKDANVQWGLPIRVFQTPLLCNHKTEGLKAPGYLYSRLSDVFSLTTHYSSLITQRSSLTITSSWTCLTLFNLLTLGIAQASLALLSLNRKFQDLSAEMNKKGSQWDAETSSAWPFTLDYYYRRNISSEEAHNSSLTSHNSLLKRSNAQRQGRDARAWGNAMCF